MLERIWYLEGDATVRSIITRKRYIDEEVETVQIEDEAGNMVQAYKMDATALSQILSDVSFVNRRLPLDRQIAYSIYYVIGIDRATRMKDIPILPPPMPDLLAS